MEHHAPIGLFAKLLKWLRDFAAMPGRIAILADMKTADADKRPICTSCGTGRIGNYVRERRSDWGMKTVGTCSSCKGVWEMSDDGARAIDFLR